MATSKPQGWIPVELAAADLLRTWSNNYLREDLRLWASLVSGVDPKVSDRLMNYQRTWTILETWEKNEAQQELCKVKNAYINALGLQLLE